MNIYYAKSVLYAYTNLEAIMEQIDELVQKKALASMTDTSPCEWQCQRIIDYTAQKDVLIDLKIACDAVLKKFTEYELDCFDYKYFKVKPKQYFENVDTQSRTYFRRQVRLAEKFAERLERMGVTNYWFEQNCLKIEFFVELLKRVKEHEILCRKNKTLKEKALISKARLLEQEKKSVFKTTA